MNKFLSGILFYLVFGFLILPIINFFIAGLIAISIGLLLGFIGAIFNSPLFLFFDLLISPFILFVLSILILIRFAGVSFKKAIIVELLSFPLYLFAFFIFSNFSFQLGEGPTIIMALVSLFDLILASLFIKKFINKSK